MSSTFEVLISDQDYQILFSVLLSFFITLRSIPVIINICNLRGLLESPLKRSSHKSPTPTFGGVSIFASTIIGYMFWNFGDEGVIMHRVIVGMVILFFLGIKDDLYALAPLKKLGSQMIASAIVVIGSDLRISHFFGVFDIHEIPYLVSVFFTIFIFVALINAFNLIDGIDGLAGGIGMIATGGFGIWFLLNNHWSLACLGLSMSASLLGFLRYNFSKTQKIFMGDTGSLLVGYVSTILAVKFIHFNVNYSFAPNSFFVSAPIIAVVLLIVPIFDTMRVFTLRIIRGKSPFKADRIHLHHLIVDNGHSHIFASSILVISTIILTALAYWLRHFLTNTQLILFVIILFGLYIILGNYLEYRRLMKVKESALAESQKARTEKELLKSTVRAN